MKFGRIFALAALMVMLATAFTPQPASAYVHHYRRWHHHYRRVWRHGHWIKIVL